MRHCHSFIIRPLLLADGHAAGLRHFMDRRGCPVKLCRSAWITKAESMCHLMKWPILRYQRWLERRARDAGQEPISWL